MSDDKFMIKWVDRGREPKCRPNPAYPNERDLDLSFDMQRSCKIDLPYPAKRCGYYQARCRICGQSIMVTTAGRPDDPRSVRIACRTGVQ